MRRLDDKKNKEKGEGMHLLSKFGLSPDSPGVDFDRERPDYTFILDSRKIGVEITKCVPSDKSTRGDLNYEKAFSLRDLILEDCENAANNLDFNDGYEVYVSLFPGTMNQLAQRCPDRNRIKQGTIDEFLTMLPEITTSTSGILGFTKECDGEFISRITAYKCDYRQDIKILHGPDGGFAQPLDPAMVESSVREKERKLEEYIKINDSISEYWLQIHIPYSETYDANSVAGYSIDSPFDRIYVTDWGGACCRIK